MVTIREVGGAERIRKKEGTSLRKKKLQLKANEEFCGKEIAFAFVSTANAQTGQTAKTPAHYNTRTTHAPQRELIKQTWLI